MLQLAATKFVPVQDKVVNAYSFSSSILGLAGAVAAGAFRPRGGIRYVQRGDQTSSRDRVNRQRNRGLGQRSRPLRHCSPCDSAVACRRRNPLAACPRIWRLPLLRVSWANGGAASRNRSTPMPATAHSRSTCVSTTESLALANAGVNNLANGGASGVLRFNPCILDRISAGGSFAYSTALLRYCNIQVWSLWKPGPP